MASNGCEILTLECSGCGRTGEGVAVEEEDEEMGMSQYRRQLLAVVRIVAWSRVRCMFSKKSFHWLPSFSAVCCLFNDPELIRSRSKRVAELLDENSVDGCRSWNHPGRPGNI